MSTLRNFLNWWIFTWLTWKKNIFCRKLKIQLKQRGEKIVQSKEKLLWMIKNVSIILLSSIEIYRIQWSI